MLETRWACPTYSVNQEVGSIRGRLDFFHAPVQIGDRLHGLLVAAQEVAEDADARILAGGA